METSKLGMNTVSEVRVRDIWMRVFEIVRRDVDAPTLWLAMQGVSPVAIQGSHFIGSLPRDMEYLASNLESSESSFAIEAALNEVIGHPTAFHLLYGEALAAWVPGQDFGGTVEEPAAAQATIFSPSPSAQISRSPHPKKGLITWDSLFDDLRLLCKTAPLIRYPHGQARLVLHLVLVISEGMDALVPDSNKVDEDMFERQLSRTIERIGTVINLDPIFISMELWRHRQRIGKDIGLPPAR